MVVQDTELFDPAYSTVLEVPMTGEHALAIHVLTVLLQPSSSNGCLAKVRITAATKSKITPAELQQHHRLVALLLQPRRLTIHGDQSMGSKGSASKRDHTTSSSLRTVTCPLAVTVREVVGNPQHRGDLVSSCEGPQPGLQGFTADAIDHQRLRCKRHKQQVASG